jgi:hypothetical protein
MNADFDKRYVDNQHDVYAFGIHRSVHYLMGLTLIFEENNIIQQPKVCSGLRLRLWKGISKLDERCWRSGYYGGYIVCFTRYDAFC